MLNQRKNLFGKKNKRVIINEYLTNNINNINVLAIMNLINLDKYCRLSLSKITLNLHQIITQILYLMIGKDQFSHLN